MLYQVNNYFHTLKYLKPIQIWDRIRRHFYRIKPCHHAAPSVRVLSYAWTSAIPKPLSLISSNRFRFLNFEKEVLFPEDWNNKALDKLWLYNLHYFDFINSTNQIIQQEVLIGIVDRWIKENPPTAGNGWEPYPLSLRIVNWIKWAIVKNQLPENHRYSLAIQVRVLSKQIEYHLLANHIIANAKALIFAGLFFDDAEAAGWLAKGLRIIKKEMSEQILADGGHFERSPMYHAIILEDILDLINIAKTYSDKVDIQEAERWKGAASQMLYWLGAMCHPDGEIALFNDAAMGISPAVMEIDSYATRLGVGKKSSIPVPLIDLQSSGYIRAGNGALTLFVDAAPIGPDYQPGHAHADTLSFELSLGKSRILVDSGTSCYNVCTERLRQRGTAAHNTVMVNGHDSSEVWSGFRVARRATIVERKAMQQSDGVVVIRAAHDGYCRLAGVGLHQREFVFSDKKLIITDTIMGKRQVSLEARFHFHPDFSLEKKNDDTAVVFDTDGIIMATCKFDTNLPLCIEQSTYHPEFGRTLSSYCLKRAANVLLPFSFTSSFYFHQEVFGTQEAEIKLPGEKVKQKYCL